MAQQFNLTDSAIEDAGVGGPQDASNMLATFWNRQLQNIQKGGTNQFKNQALPLARVKKIMKLDDEVKMISAEAPCLFAKAAEIFISELTLRAWIHTEDNKRRTLQRNDIAMAISKFDQFDFLIDIVPRDDLKPQKARSGLPDPAVQYYLQLQQQAAQQLQTTKEKKPQLAPPTTQPTYATAIIQPNGQIQLVNDEGQVIQQPMQIQVIATPSDQTTISVAPTKGTPPRQSAKAGVVSAKVAATPVSVKEQTPSSSSGQIINIQSVSGSAQPAANTHQIAMSTETLEGPTNTTSSDDESLPQVYQQVVTASGEIKHIPVQLSEAQMQAIRLQMQQSNSTENTTSQLQQSISI